MRHWLIVTTMGASALLGCGNSGGTPGPTQDLVMTAGDMAGAGGGDMTTTGGADMTGGKGDMAGGSDNRTLNVTVVGLDEMPVSGVALGAEEDGTVAATTDKNGKAMLTVPAGKKLTLTATKSGYAKTAEQPITLAKSGMLSDFVFVVAKQAEFDAIQKAGGAAPNTAVVSIAVSTAMDSPCNLVGVTFATTPASGKAVYVAETAMMSTMLDPAATSVKNDQTLSQGFITGVTGKNLTPVGTPADKCKFATFPETFGAITTLGPFDAEPGVFHDFSLDLM